MSKPKAVIAGVEVAREQASEAINFDVDDEFMTDAHFVNKRVYTHSISTFQVAKDTSVEHIRISFQLYQISFLNA